ncbi:helix-turn-helix domain-containing protein [Terribacillus saccharophilus]|uniref:helix-turn-helix domain-containing protein n=1 Tax=Terribacillus saccharophilus TaxID=361277 RepID=UPI003D2CE0F4
MGGKFQGSPIPEKLKTARLARGYSITDLAKEIGVTRQAISQYELGQTVPRPEILLRLIQVLEFPRTYFYKQEEYQESKSAIFFRSQLSSTKKSRDMQSIRADWVKTIVNYVNGYLKLPKVNIVPTLDKSLNDIDEDFIEELANDLREAWELGNRPIENLTRVVERNGFVVAQTNFNDEKLDAFSLWITETPIIVLNNQKESAARRRFNIAHELGHLLMHSSIVDDTQELTQQEFKRMESQAHAFASALLLPKDSFINSVYSPKIEHFVELKRYWNVSIAAMVRRCKDLGLINENQYLYLNKELSRRKWRTTEPLDDSTDMEYPILLSKSIQMILDHNVDDVEQILEKIPYPLSDVEALSNLSSNTLRRKSNLTNLDITFE